MKDKMIEWIFLLVTTLLVPCFITVLISGQEKRQEEKKSGIILEYENGQIVDMEDFLPYVIAGEISLEYGKEALKAQTVIARTNLMRELNGKREAKISDLALSYLTPEKFEAGLGQKTRESILNILKKAVNETYGQVITYDGVYIEALYHPVSIGTTISSEEIFGKTRPYLTPVSSSQDVEAEEYMTIKEMTAQDALKCFHDHRIGMDLTKNTVINSLKVEEKTANGYVKQVSVGKDKITGDKVKEIFSLNSTNFYLEEYNGNLRIIVLGKGHGIGMSQYGANKMAENGCDYKDILKYYYPGIEIKIIEDIAARHV